VRGRTREHRRTGLTSAAHGTRRPEARRWCRSCRAQKGWRSAWCDTRGWLATRRRGAPRRPWVHRLPAARYSTPLSVQFHMSPCTVGGCRKM